MTEDVLQYIWQTQSFTISNLHTSAGQELQVFAPGSLNTGSGPDFANARIKLEEMLWSGDIEIHTLASHWDQHAHNRDENYDRVILHVVWQEDKIIKRQDGTIIPTLELKEYLDPNWYERYNHLMNSLAAVPCEKYLVSVDPLIITEACQNALINRLEVRSAEVLKLLKANNGDWQQTSLQWLFAQFGFQKNKAAFQQLAERVEFGVLRKLNSQRQIEAYLFGLSGLLPNDSANDYVAELRREYLWLDRKYGLINKEMSVMWWKFMRMRPANFPTLRLAQLASLLFTKKNILRVILELDLEQLSNLFEIRHFDYWQNHYHFGSTSTKKITGMGVASQNILLINVVAVTLVAYGMSIAQPEYVKKAVHLLEKLQPEANRVTRLWSSLGISVRNAADSQGLLGLFNDYCKKSGCLSCSVGQYIVKRQ